ncbi:MAG: hypothetical protein PUJ80_00315 [Verrucomicrobiota bacterium]|nr:hypothetical protein [Verrucomicrobiota bacterium]
MSREGRSSLRPLADAGGSSSRSTENGMVATDARERVPPVATYPPNEVSRASGRKRGRTPVVVRCAGMD